MNERKYCRKSDAVPQGKVGDNGQDRERSKEVEELRGQGAFSFVWRRVEQGCSHRQRRKSGAPMRYTNSKSPGSAALRASRN